VTIIIFSKYFFEADFLFYCDFFNLCVANRIETIIK